MARGWSISLLVLLTLPIAAPATAPVPGQARWASAPPLSYRAEEGDTLSSLSERALVDPSQSRILAGANGLSADQKLRAGQIISIPSSMLRREMLSGKVIGFTGDVRLADGVALALGSEVQEGDVISTGANSFVTLDMGPAGRMTLPSQSRLRIAALHQIALTGAIQRRLEPLPQKRRWLMGWRGSKDDGSISG